jgi:hypothetical protein
VSTEIVRTEKLKDRIAVLSKFLEVADVRWSMFVADIL